ncbi:MAG: glycosyltransferase [Sulfitobacter sp.]
MSHFNRHWADPKPFATGWTESVTFHNDAANAKHLLNEEFGPSGSIVVKDPRFSRVLPVWRDAITARHAKPVYLIACRNPLEVARSLARRDKLSIEHGLQLWLSHMLEAEISTRGLRRYVINYEDLLRDWRRTLRPVCLHPGLPDLATMDKSRAEAIDRFLVPAERHHVASKADLDVDQNIPDIVKRAYEAFLHFADRQNGSEFDQLVSDWQNFWRCHSPGTDRSAYVESIPEVQIEESKMLENEGRIAEALALTRSAAATAGNRASYYFRAGILSDKTGDLTGAIVALRQAIFLDDGPVAFHMNLLRILRKQGDRGQESADLQAALSRHPEHAPLHHQLGVWLERNGDLTGAADAMRHALLLDDKPVGFYLSLARVLAKQGNREQEAECLRAALIQHPEYADFHHQLGVCLEQTGDLDGAAAALRQALTLDDVSLGNYWSLARVLGKQGNREQETSTLRAAIQRHPTHAPFHHQLGYCLERSGDLAQAEMAIAETARLDKTELDQLIEKTPSLLLSTGTGRPDAQGRLNIDQKHKLVRLLAWQASRYLAEDAEKLNSRETPAPSNDAPWPMGRSQPIEAENPVIPPVETETRPLLSAMIPAYEVKSAKWLARAIESVLAQNLPHDEVEVVVIDDGSTGDVARQVARSFGSRVSYVRNPERLGLSGNFNRCIGVSTGKFVHILHQDDWIAPGFYDALLGPLRADDRLVAAFSSTVVVDDANRTLHIDTLDRQKAGPLTGWLETIALRQRITFPSMIVRRSAYEGVGGFSPSLLYSMDWDMWTRLAVSGPVWHDPRPLAYYTSHSGSETFRLGAHDRAVDCMHTVLRNGRLLPERLRAPIARAACHHLLVNACSFISPAKAKSVPVEERQQTLRLLLRGQTNEDYIALAQSLLDD